jgi:hypothetical protein
MSKGLREVETPYGKTRVETVRCDARGCGQITLPPAPRQWLRVDACFYAVTGANGDTYRLVGDYCSLGCLTGELTAWEQEWRERGREYYYGPFAETELVSA